MRLLLTRPEGDSAALAQLLRGMGHEVVIAPLLTIRFIEDARIPRRDWQALMVTSANGARALGRHARAGELVTIPVLAVGEASAEAVREQGFTEVRAAGGDVDALAELAAVVLEPSKGPLLHVAGSVVAGDLVSVLGAKGFVVERAVLYEARMATSLPEGAEEELKRGAIEGVLFYSPRTARNFAHLADGAGLADKLGDVTAYCLSRAVAEALGALRFQAVKIASEPSQKALLALISA